MRTIMFLLACLCFTIKVSGQTIPSLQVSGKVIDSISQKPLDYVTVVLKDEKKIPAKSVLSKADGSFALKGLKPGNYLLTIVSVGYRASSVPLKLESKDVDLGSIFIKPSSERLKEVVISADKPLIRQEIDRIAYDVKADPESKVNNVLEMMRKVPLLSLDADDNIQLQGNSNYKILINGRPSGMMERNPKDILRSMPASSIERIEVITTPPAKYDGEGLAGIINIITNKKAADGFNGTVNASERFPVGGPGIGGSLNMKTGKFGITANAGASRNNSPETTNSNSRLTAGVNPTDLFQSGTKDFSGKSGYAGTELSFEIDSLNLISGQFNINGNTSASISNQNSILNSPGSLLQSYDLLNTRDGSGSGMDAAFNYQLGFKKDKNRMLTFSYRYYRYSNDQFNSIDVFNPVSYVQPDFRQDNEGSSSEKTFQIDYVQPIKKVTMEAGIKGIFRNNRSNFKFSSINESTGMFETDLLRTNKFSNTQDVFGIYNTYQFNLKKWGVKAGIRIEQTEIGADFTAAETLLEQSSFNVIPSVSVNRKFNNMSSVNFGFTSRIQRPGINQLNPFVDRSNPNFESTGNPSLKPMTGNSIEAGYSYFKKATINTGLRLILFNDLIMPQISVDPQTNITRSSYGNTGSARLLAANVNIGYPVTSKLKLNVSGNLNYGKVKGEVNGVQLENEGLMSRVFTSAGYRFDKGWNATASMNYNGPNLSLQGTSNSFTGSSFSVNKDLMKSKLSLSAAANNVFSKYREAINFTNGSNFSQESFNQSYLRNFTVSMNYRFGELKEKIKKNKRGINNTDVSEEGGNL